jgi:Ni/Fe-hydrogenase subunit HybB-like protein
LVWLNRPFFFGRALLFFALWIGLGRRLVNQGRGAAPFILVFGVTFSLVNFDWIMSLEPVWSSTLMAIYGFSGMFLQGIALITLTAILLRRIGVLPSITKAQNHDLGKLLFAFSAFWGYIWLCQFLLVWYANLPEETGPLQRMMAMPWSPLFYLNVGLNFVLPFLLLLRRKAKEHEGILALASLLALAGHWLDVYLMVIPPVMGGVFPPVGLPELGGLLLQFGLAHMVCWPVFVHRVDPDQAVPLAE